MNAQEALEYYTNKANAKIDKKETPHIKHGVIEAKIIKVIYTKSLEGNGVDVPFHEKCRVFTLNGTLIGEIKD